MEHAFVGKGYLRPPEEEIRRLERENEELREEREIRCFLYSSPGISFIGMTLLFDL